MPQPPPPREGCLRAWELYSRPTPLRRVWKILRDEGYPCGSHETARQWALKGRQFYATDQDLDPKLQRYRDADGLEQWMDKLGQAVEAEDVSLLDALAHLKWLYQWRARLIGTDAPVRANITLTGEEPQPAEFIQRMVGFTDPEETFGDPNGHR